jgi:peroxiredoxin
MRLHQLVPMLALTLVIADGCGGTSHAAELTVGDPAPDFALEGSDGKVHRLADYRGKTVVLAWFPKAFTGG